MAHKSSVYLDTSVLNALFQEPVERKQTTQRFFEEALPLYDAYTSDLVIAEIEATEDADLQRRLLEKVEQCEVLPVAPGAKELSREYLRYLRMPDTDALHLAIASIEGMNYLVSWNIRHHAREKTRRVVDAVNFVAKLPPIFIVTPEDLLE
jgi:predicted nucleic acid-binding protein